MQPTDRNILFLAILISAYSAILLTTSALMKSKPTMLIQVVPTQQMKPLVTPDPNKITKILTPSAAPTQSLVTVTPKK